jgi:hypothetical protein
MYFLKVTNILEESVFYIFRAYCYSLDMKAAGNYMRRGGMFTANCNVSHVARGPQSAYSLL